MGLSASTLHLTPSLSSCKQMSPQTRHGRLWTCQLPDTVVLFQVWGFWSHARAKSSPTHLCTKAFRKLSMGTRWAAWARIQLLDIPSPAAFISLTAMGRTACIPSTGCLHRCDAQAVVVVNRRGPCSWGSGMPHNGVKLCLRAVAATRHWWLRKAAVRDHPRDKSAEAATS